MLFASIIPLSPVHRARCSKYDIAAIFCSGSAVAAGCFYWAAATQQRPGSFKEAAAEATTTVSVVAYATAAQ